tara:strand:- start:92 stop:496 length:405 start_codon:yes stop_codon:yes gene_type:complete
MKICFVIPTFNDEYSLKRLIDNINKELKNFTLHFIIIDDYSSDDYKTLDTFHKLDLIKLKKNQGSQKAISIGLKYLKDKEIDFDYVIIMDAAGSTPPTIFEINGKQYVTFLTTGGNYHNYKNESSTIYTFGISN